jgi:hypothetical protein
MLLVAPLRADVGPYGCVAAPDYGLKIARVPPCTITFCTALRLYPVSRDLLVTFPNRSAASSFDFGLAGFLGLGGPYWNWKGTVLFLRQLRVRLRQARWPLRTRQPGAPSFSDDLKVTRTYLWPALGWCFRRVATLSFQTVVKNAFGAATCYRIRHARRDS